MQTISKHSVSSLLLTLLVTSFWSCKTVKTPTTTQNSIANIVSGYDQVPSEAYKAPIVTAMKKGWKPMSKDQVKAEVKKLITQANIYPVPANTFYYQQYATGSTNASFTTFYRVFGGVATLGGSFVTLKPIKSKEKTIKESALITAWGNTVTWEAKIQIPKGTIISVGLAGPQLSTKSPPQFLAGGGSQMILPFGWIKNARYKVAVRKLDASGKPISNFKDIPFSQRAALQTAIKTNDKFTIKRIMGIE
ncbi:hypothetical protein [Microscilla marina]|uniref:hypothetical protein n=1 Tax=Microscilla marina TaxID=1027 RepID=UPI0012F82A28|nr:hypothetical protein [Microscilla marina]